MCTSVRIKTTADDVVIGRTMEFAADLGWKLMVAPRSTKFTGTAPGGPGHTWSADHGFVGVTALGRPAATDGINEAGLYAGLLYLPGYTSYQDSDGVAAEQMISADELASLVLAAAGSVAEAIATAEAIVVWNRAEEALGGSILPVHLVLHDSSGASAVIEWVDGVRRVHDNPIGVCTNSPPFEWHTTNLRNYVNLSATNVGPLKLGDQRIAALGQGSGLLGLPGDWTPPSRFVRATALAGATDPVESTDEAMLAALHIINSFDVPKGVVRGPEGGDFTAWSSVCDLAGGHYAVRTYDDPTPRLVNLGDLGLDQGERRELELPRNGSFEALAV